MSSVWRVKSGKRESRYMHLLRRRVDESVLQTSALESASGDLSVARRSAGSEAAELKQRLIFVSSLGE